MCGALGIGPFRKVPFPWADALAAKLINDLGEVGALLFGDGGIVREFTTDHREFIRNLRHSMKISRPRESVERKLRNFPVGRRLGAKRMCAPREAAIVR